MSSTAASNTQSASPSTNQTAQTSRAGQAGQRRAGEPGADNSLFAQLLSLLGDTHEQALPELGAGADGDPAEDPALLASEDTPDANPLAAIAGWPGSPVPADAGTAESLGSGLNKASADAPVETEPAMQAVDEPAPELDLAANRAAHEAPPAAASRPSASQKGLSATALAQALPVKGSASSPAGTATIHQDGNGMVWRRTSAGATESLTATGTAHLAGVRSTVALNDRFGHLAGHATGALQAREAAAGAGATPALGSGSVGTQGTAGSATVPGAVGGPDASLAAGSASGADADGGESASDTNTGQQDGTDAQAFEARADGEEQQISHWGTQHLRHASLRVGQGAQDAIDIQLSVKGQEVQVDFRTDNADARATLENSADDSLAEMLQRSGIQLASVSVGAQSQQGGERNGASSESTATRASRSAARVADAPAAPAPTRTAPLRADGSRPLDLFV